MKVKEVVGFLKDSELDFLQTKSFSKLPGIYAFFYIGDSFPCFEKIISKHDVIYIGKTESSQEKRSGNTHFTTGKTGSSTVRKSIGSILCQGENLQPIPRNDIDYKNGRSSHFKFDRESEYFITKWMQTNLALSFYEYPKSKQAIDMLETEIIKELIPILNIDHKNPSNPFKVKIKQLRRRCAEIANLRFENKSLAEQEMGALDKQIKVYSLSNEGEIYIDNVTESDVKKQAIRIKAENKYLFPQGNAHTPNTYPLSFRIENVDFIANYKIGSRDGKSRSGILKLGKTVFKELLTIKAGNNFKICKIKEKYIIKLL